MTIKLVNNIVTTDRFSLLEEKINNLYNPVLLTALRKGDINLADIDKRFWTNDMVLAYLEFDGNFIEKINEPTEEMCVKAIEFGDDDTIYKIDSKYRTEKVLMMAVTKNPSYLGAIPKDLKTDKICYCAIAMDPMAILNVENKTEHMCLAVVRMNPMTIKFIHNPSDSVIQEAINLNGDCIHFVDESKWNFNLFIDSVKSNPRSIRYFYDKVDCCENEHLSIDFLIKSALYLDPYIINDCEFFKLPEYHKYAKCAIMVDPLVYMDMPSVIKTEELDKFACKLDARMLSYVSNYTMDVIIEAFRTNADIASKCWARQAYKFKFLLAHLYAKLEFLHKFTHTIEYKE